MFCLLLGEQVFNMMVYAPMAIAADLPVVQHQFTAAGITFSEKRIEYQQKDNILFTSACKGSGTHQQASIMVDRPQFIGQVRPQRTEVEIVGGVEITRTRVDTPHRWPYCAFGHLEIRLRDGKVCGGSGALISPHHVLTCAHNVFDHKYGTGWAESIVFYPGLNERSAPFSMVPAVGTFVYEVYTQDRNANNFDIALLTLTRPVGSETGYAGLSYMDDETLKLQKIEITGYPHDKGFDQMWTMFNNFKTIEPERLTYKIHTEGGQSGSPIWVLNLSDPYILGVHTHGSETENHNLGTRLSRDKFLHIIRWMSLTGELRNHVPRPISEVAESERPYSRAAWLGIAGSIGLAAVFPPAAGAFMLFGFVPCATYIMPEDSSTGLAQDYDRR